MYITFAELKAASRFDPVEWDELNARRSATVDAWRELTQGMIDDRLRFRYAVPFDLASPPRSVKGWQIVLMDEMFLGHRRTPGAEAPQDSDLTALGRAVLATLDAAKDLNSPALPELPLRADTSSASGVSRGGPMMAGPSTLYGFFDQQAARRDEGGW